MSTQPRLTPKTAFGPFAFDEVSGDLEKHGHRIRLQGQPLQILSMLVARPGGLVTREELQLRLWGGAALADADHGLNAAVNKLRQALGDSADHPRYVETVPGRGYRFIAPVKAPTRTVVVEMPPAGSPRLEGLERSGSHGRKILLGGAIGLILGTLAAGYWLGARQGATGLAAPIFEIVPPEGFELEGASSRQAFALSPDGARLAYTAMDVSGLLHLFVRELSSLESKQIADSAGAHTLFWGAGADSLYFTRRGKLRRLDLGTGKHAEVGDSPGFLMHGSSLGRGPLLMFTGSGSFWINEDSGAIEASAERYPWAQRLPGEQILYTQLATTEPHHTVSVGTLGTNKNPQRVLEAHSRAVYADSTQPGGPGHLLFIRGGSLLAQPFDAARRRIEGTARPVAERVYSFFPTAAADFSAAHNGTLAYAKHVSRSQLIWVDRDGQKLSAVSAEGVSLKSGRLSPDGNTVATAMYEVEFGSQNIWLIDQKSGHQRLLSAEFGLRDCPVWSPDSRRIAFLRGGGGVFPHLRIRGLGAEDKEIELRSGGFQLPTDWSPDGRYVVFVNTGFPRVASETQSDVWLADVNAGKVSPLLRSKFHETSPAFSPDGRWLAFTSNESGEPEIYVQRFTGGDAPGVSGPRFPVTKSGAQALRWRRDGREIFYLAFDGKVHAVPVQLSETPVVGTDTALFSISLAARAAIHSILGFDVSPDGQRFLIPVTTSPERASIIVKQNWESELKHPTGLTQPFPAASK
jgi:DNA-binding winged helix-turn-helix (wHTH) protein